jgi:hypothetical protein
MNTFSAVPWAQLIGNYWPYLIAAVFLVVMAANGRTWLKERNK